MKTYRSRGWAAWVMAASVFGATAALLGISQGTGTGAEAARSSGSQATTLVAEDLTVKATLEGLAASGWKPAEKAPPADAVAACRTWLKEVAEERGEPAPGPNAKVAARLDGAPGTVLILADSKYWAGCDTAFARNGSEGSIRQPAKIAKPAPGDAEAFEVANNLIPIKGKEYEYYWAAGQLPSGVSKISYTFPDGRTTNAVIKGNYWLMQHQTATPWKEGSPPGPQIKVTLFGPNGQSLRTFLLVWGEDTCAQVSHGC
jgi:hypothetical protein